MAFTIKVKPSGDSFELEPGETVLEAGLRNKLGFPFGCKDGLCGACKGKIVSGTFSYGDKEIRGLSSIEQSLGQALFCQAKPSSDLEIEIALSDPLPTTKKLPCKLIRKEILSHEVVALWLKCPPTEQLQFLAGQYIDILLKDGRYRSFSIANAPCDNSIIELHIRHIDGGDFTGYAYYDIQEKEILRIHGPLGNFYLREDSDRPIIFMAGGTGFAPIKGIIEYAIDKNIQRSMHLYWGVRSQRDLYHDELAKQWAQEHEHIHYVPVLSEADPDEQWSGRSGFVHQAIMDDFPDLSGFDLYAGGSPAMVYAGQDAFAEIGLDQSRYYSDAFEFQAPKATADTDTADS
jgi:CDP-4-dehydro-6-deoxyglucose reductase